MRLEGILMFTKGTKNLEMRSANLCTGALAIGAELWLVWGSREGGYGQWDHPERASCNSVRWDHHSGVSDSLYGYESLWGQTTIGLKKNFLFLFFAVAFHLLRVVLAFKQNKAFERIIIISPYLSKELLYIPTILGHMFPQPTLKDSSPNFKSKFWFNPYNYYI
ncbi:unnamed protein product, partial [Vitis vinifera]